MSEESVDKQRPAIYIPILCMQSLSTVIHFLAELAYIPLTTCRFMHQAWKNDVC